MYFHLLYLFVEMYLRIFILFLESSRGWLDFKLAANEVDIPQELAIDT